MKITWTILFSLIITLTLAACKDNNVTSNKESNTTDFTLTSSVMDNGGNLPITYTCDSDSISPPLHWYNAPQGTKYYTIIMHHNAPDKVHWYWTMFNIDADITSVESGKTVGEVGSNSVNNINAYAPPCSKGPGEKSYTYTIYALSEPLTFNDTALKDAAFNDSVKINRETLLTAMKDITLDAAVLNVNYRRDNANIRDAKDRKPRPRKNRENRPRPKPIKQPDLTVNIDSARCDQIRGSINDAGFEQEVSVSCHKDYAYVASSTYPTHEVMTGITGTNEQIPVPEIVYAAPIKLSPKKADKLTTIDAAVGVAVNGVPIYDYSSQGELDVNQYDERHDTLALGQLDICGGHAGRGDDYHYHVSPTCMIDVMKNKASDAIIGWAYDGYPLYGDKNPDGSDIATDALDVCNGQADATYGYRYQTSTKPPYIIQCLVGEVDTNILPRVSPLSGDTHKIRADLKPPRDGVENLKHTIAKDGSRTMTYTYKNEEYFTTYTPSSTKKYCYDFKQRTISNNGKIETGTFCRGNDDKPKPTSAKLKPTIATGKYAPNANAHNLKLDVWADNWFAAYISEDLLIEDSTPITTERSFNAESITFSASYPIQLNLIIKDFKQNDTGLEYIGASNQQMGDGGFILQITDTKTNKLVAVSNNQWQCEVLHQAPLNKLCEHESNPIAGEGLCQFNSKQAPENWMKNNFDSSAWPKATEHLAASVGPKDGYDEIKWDESAQLIWGDDLETDNTLICRIKINQPQ